MSSPWPTGHRFAERTRAKHATIHALLAAGHSKRSVARQLGMGLNTILRFSRATTPEELFTGQWQSRATKLDVYKPYLDQRWQEGCTNAWKLWEEIKEQGYPDGGLDPRPLPCLPRHLASSLRVARVLGWSGLSRRGQPPRWARTSSTPTIRRTCPSASHGSSCLRAICLPGPARQPERTEESPGKPRPSSKPLYTQVGSTPAEVAALRAVADSSNMHAGQLSMTLPGGTAAVPLANRPLSNRPPRRRGRALRNPKPKPRRARAS